MAEPTVESELRRLFPRGTDLLSEVPFWSSLPFLPVDAFAAAAHLLAASGAYQYIVAPFNRAGGGQGLSYPQPAVEPRPERIARWVALGRAWASDVEVYRRVDEHWRRLWGYRRAKLVMTPSDRAPRWWAIAHSILVVADEASAGVGYMSAEESASKDTWANRIISTVLVEAQTPWIIESTDHPGDDLHTGRHIALDSISSAAREVARVQPKGRTTELGCTMRTLSHNLALLPPHGHPNAYWHRPLTRNKSDLLPTLNILAIPFPFVVPDGCFAAREATPSPKNERWGRYKIRQRWLTPAGPPDGPDDETLSTADSRRAFIDFVDALIARAQKGATKVNGIVLPEYALDWKTYDDLVRHARDNHPDIEFVISGVSQDCLGDESNIATCTTIVDNPFIERREARTHSRRKHHRWRIDDPQIASYGLERELAPGVTWWEHLAVESRVLNVDVLRSSSTLTAVICEDLARVEPGLTLLRTLGVDLVFALLMDGPQVSQRWPGVYAVSLADDPGSAVMTLTSLGLVTRSNSRWKGGSPRNIVGLWKNRAEGVRRGFIGAGRRAELRGARQNGRALELDLGDGQALLVKLTRSEAQDVSLDGRRNEDATAWYLRSYRPVAIDRATLIDRGWTWITG